MEFPDNEDPVTDTIEAEVDKYINMRPTEMGLLGQALIVFEKCQDPRTDISGLTGDWWMQQNPVVQRRMVQGLVVPQLVSLDQMCGRYINARNLE